MHFETGVPVSNIDIDRLVAIRHNDSSVRACVDRISEGVFASGIGMETRDQHLLRKYTAAAHDAYEWLTTVGLVPVCMVHDEDLGCVVPEIPAFGTLQLHVGVGMSGKLRYTAKFLFRGEFAVRPRIRVWAESGQGPDIHGTIRTKLMTASKERGLESFMAHRAMVAEMIRTNPPLITEDRQTRPGVVEGVSMLATGQVIEDAEEARLRVVETNRLNHMRIHAQNQGTSDDYFASQCELVEYFAPCERVVSAPRPIPTNFPALVPFKQMNNDLIFELFGVPCGSSSRQVGVANQSTSADAKTMNETVKRASMVIELFLNHVFEHCKILKKSEDLMEATSVLQRCANGDGQEDAEDLEFDYASLEDNGKSQIRLLNMPDIDLDCLTVFRDQGYISHVEAQLLVRGRLGLPELDTPIPQPPPEQTEGSGVKRKRV